MTPEQHATLRAHIEANTDQIVIDALAIDDIMTISIWYSQLSEPAFIVWRSQVGTREIDNAIEFSGVGGFIARSAGERDAFMMITSRGVVDPSRPNIRAAFSNIFSGSGAGAPETRAALLAVSKRTATNIEAILSTGTGSDASPATLVYEGPLQYQDALAAMRL